MSTSRSYQVFTGESKIVCGTFYAIVTNKSETRVVHQTPLHETRYWAIKEAHRWADKSRSQAAKSLEQTDET